MAAAALYDIREVCKQLATTSRTLRFYEEKGLITSTKAPFSARRQYTGEQVECIRHILVLRTLGLSVKTIAMLQSQDTDLKEAVLSRRAEILASIHTKVVEIARLNEALAMIEVGDDVFAARSSPPLRDAAYEQRVRECAQAIVSEDIERLYGCFSTRLAAYLPPAVYKTVWADTAQPLGKFVSFEAIERDNDHAHVFYQYIRYQRLGLKVKLVFHGGMVDGLWLTYYEI